MSDEQDYKDYQDYMAYVAKQPGLAQPKQNSFLDDADASRASRANPEVLQGVTDIVKLGMPAGYKPTPEELSGPLAALEQGSGMAGGAGISAVMGRLGNFFKSSGATAAVKALNANPEEEAALLNRGAGETLQNAKISRFGGSSATNKLLRMQEAAAPLAAEKQAMLSGAEGGAPTAVGPQGLRFPSEDVASEAIGRVDKVVPRTQGAQQEVRPLLKELDAMAGPGETAEGTQIVTPGAKSEFTPSELDRLKQYWAGKGAEAKPTLFKTGSSMKERAYSEAAGAPREMLNENIPGLQQVNKPLSDLLQSQKVVGEPPTPTAFQMLRSPAKGMIKAAMGRGAETYASGSRLGQSMAQGLSDPNQAGMLRQLLGLPIPSNNEGER